MMARNVYIHAHLIAWGNNKLRTKNKFYYKASHKVKAINIDKTLGVNTFNGVIPNWLYQMRITFR